MKIDNIIEKPIITEKSLSLAERGIYTFKVNVNARKKNIADFVSSNFKVDVIDVRTCIIPGKKRRLAKTSRFIKTKKWKKAIVSVKAGQKIELSGEKKQ